MQLREDDVRDCERLAETEKLVGQSNSRDLFFVKLVRNPKGFGYHPSDSASSPCEDTVINDHFRFRSTEVMIHDDAVAFLFEKIHPESDGQGLVKNWSSAMSSLAEALALCSFSTEPGERHQAACHEIDSNQGDDRVARFSSDFKQRIEAALEPLRAPLAFVFQNRGEAERKRRHKFLAREEKKLALRRKKIQLKRRRGDRFRIPSSAKPSVRQGLLPL
jgi:hypothetical protein